MTKEKFLRAIAGDPATIVEHQENVQFEAQLVKVKAELKVQKEEVATLVAELEARGRELSRRMSPPTSLFCQTRNEILRPGNTRDREANQKCTSQATPTSKRNEPSSPPSHPKSPPSNQQSPLSAPAPRPAYPPTRFSPFLTPPHRLSSRKNQPSCPLLTPALRPSKPRMLEN